MLSDFHLLRIFQSKLPYFYSLCIGENLLKLYQSSQNLLLVFLRPWDLGMGKNIKSKLFLAGSGSKNPDKQPPPNPFLTSAGSVEYRAGSATLHKIKYIDHQTCGYVFRMKFTLSFQLYSGRR